MKVITPQSEIIQKLAEYGWAVKKIDFKQGQYFATGESETTGQEFEGKGVTPEAAAAQLLMYASRASQLRSMAKTGAWTSPDWHGQKHDIAKAYKDLPVYDQKAVPAWQTLAAESKAQANAIRNQISLDYTDDPDPYDSHEELADDLHQKKHLNLSRANLEHPIWTPDQHLDFRLVHNVLGHAPHRNPYSWGGEVQAALAHMPHLSPLAREALFTEVLGKKAYNDVYHGQGPQKVGLMSEYLHPVQQNEGEHVFVPHGTMPDFLNQEPQPAQAGEWAGAYTSPLYSQKPAVMQGYFSSSKDGDPNEFWHSTDKVPPISPFENPQADYLDIVGNAKNAMNVDTDWQEEDEQTQRRAIMNAFRAVLDPQKYQNLHLADPDLSDKELQDNHPDSLNLNLYGNIREQLDTIVDAAKTDVDEGGKGFLFRKTLEGLNLGVTPQTISNAWYLLAPFTSELSKGGDHIRSGLRRLQESDPQDHYKHERMLRAFKDATGYSHVPLGLYSEGLENTIRNPNSLKDPSSQRVLQPTPYTDSPNWIDPDWIGSVEFEQGREPAERAARLYEQEKANEFPTTFVRPTSAMIS